jgi:anaerobic selenocysteine-containing dehydrogenase
VGKDQSNAIERWGKSYCPYCGVGCGLLAKVQAGAVTRIKGDPDHPSSRGDLCLKAVYLPEILRTPEDSSTLKCGNVRTNRSNVFPGNK